jgi:dihydrofolate reductase
MMPWEKGLEGFTLSEPCISMVAAMGRNQVIGVQGKLPWHIPEDLKRFKAVTLGQPMIMGRKTFDSIGRVLPDRKTIVLSRSPAVIHPEVLAARDPWDAIREAAGWMHAQKDSGKPIRPEVMICGGGEIYQLFLPYAHRIYLTEVDSAPRGDALFPKLGPEWKALLEEPISAEPRAVFRVCSRT